MMSIFFDFSDIYKSEYVKRNAGSSFYKYLDKLDIDLKYFINNIFVKDSTFFVACSCMERRLYKDINFEYYKNFFIRSSDNKYQFISFIGIDSVTSQSGTSAYHGPISKTGCKFGRTILFNVVTTLLQISAHTDKSNPIYLFFRKKTI
jgi:hypothetical protein